MGEPPTWGTAMRAYSIDLRERVLADCDELVSNVVDEV